MVVRILRWNTSTAGTGLLSSADSEVRFPKISPLRRLLAATTNSALLFQQFAFPQLFRNILVQSGFHPQTECLTAAAAACLLDGRDIALLLLLLHPGRRSLPKYYLVLLYTPVQADVKK